MRDEINLQTTKILAGCHDLAVLLKDSPEFAAYQKAKEAVGKNESVLELLMKFRALQMRVQVAHLGKAENLALEKELDDMYFTLSMYPEINDFLNAEYRFSKLVGEMQKIFASELGVEQAAMELPNLN
ncbi:MAG: YlbF family regulator [Peptococcaceae bacterium]|nr:YlbF family regulator [Peptococcaceae bacterium]